MKHPPRGLTEEEAALWARLAASVKPLRGRVAHAPLPAAAAPEAVEAVNLPKPASPIAGRSGSRLPARQKPAASPAPPPAPGLDSHWDRRLAKAAVSPDFTLDLHGHTLDQAHRRLDHGLAQARAMGARLVLVITGKPRAVDAADRGERRGAIRAKLLDWLAAGPHAGEIAAIRPAHRRHGGEGALYLVLRARR